LIVCLANFNCLASDLPHHLAHYLTIYLICKDDAKQAEKYGKAAMAYSGKYLFVDHPEYTEDVHEAFIREAQRIMGESPWRA
jgi:hypothetical protein